MADNLGGIEGSVSISTSDLDRGLKKAESMMDKSAERLARSAERAAKRVEEANRRAADKAARDAEITAKATEKAADRIARSAEAAANRQAAASERAARAAERQAEMMARRAAAEEARVAIAAEAAADRKALAAKRAADQQIREAQRAAAAAQRADLAAWEQANAWHNQSFSDGRGGDPLRRRGAIARTAFNFANVTQDLVQGGPASTINNLLQPTLWADMSTAIGGGRAALAGFGATGAAVLAAVVVHATALNESLKEAELGWGDLDDILANSTGVQAVSSALGELGDILGVVESQFEQITGLDIADSFGELAQDISWLSGQLSGLGGLVDYAVGWAQATEAVRKHKEELAATERVQSALYGKQGKDGARKGGAVDQFKSAEQKAEAERLDLIGQAIADMGGKGGLDGLIKKFGSGDPDKPGAFEFALDKALSGDAAGIKQLKQILGGSGIDTTALDMAARGSSPEIEAEAAKKAAKAAAAIQGGYGKSKDDAAAAAKAEADRRASTAAGDLQERYNRGGGSMSEADVASALSAAGANPADAAATRANLAESYAASVQERALRDNVSPEAARGLIADDYARADAEKAQRESDRARSEALDAATTARPGIAATASGSYMRGILSGMDPGHMSRVVADNLAETLAGSGMNAEQARIAAEALAGEARADAERTLTGQYEGGRQQMMEQRPRGPELFDASGLYSKVALAAAGGEQDKQLAALNKQNDLLQRLVRLTENNGGGGQIFLR